MKRLKGALETSLPTLRIIYGAQAGGVVLFGAFVLFMWMQSPGTAPAAGSLRVLSLAHVVLLLSCLAAQQIVSAAMFSRQRCEGFDEGGVVGALHTLFITRLSILEGPALLGLVICFLGASSGALSSEPVYQLNFLSPALFLGYTALTFPTREKAGRIIAETLGLSGRL